jgi:hypothetical protein
MRHPGHPSRQIGMVPIVPVDCRIGRPVPPPELSDRERELWEKLGLSRRPNWFSGSEQILAAYVTVALACEDLQAKLRKTKAGMSERYLKLLRAHRLQATFAAALATKLRLVPLSKTDKHLPNDGYRPLPNMMGYYSEQARELEDEVSRAVDGERSFEKLRAHMQRNGPFR